MKLERIVPVTRGSGAHAPARRATTRRAVPAVVNVVVAALLAWSGYIHYDLYANHGYRHIHTIGPAFLIQAGGSFAVALLLALSVALPGSFMLSVLAAGLSGGALLGFVLSRTSGVAGFEEHGFVPAPDAAISVIVEIAVLAILAVVAALRVRDLRRAPAPSGRVAGAGAAGGSTRAL